MKLPGPQLYIILAVVILLLGLIIQWSFANSKKVGLYVIPEHSTIKFNPNISNSYRHITKSLDQFMEKYDKARLEEGKVIECSEERAPTDEEVCYFNTDDLYRFNVKDKGIRTWKYNSNTPCVLLSFRDMPNFIPQAYESMGELPEDMPTNLRNYIKHCFDNLKVMPKNVWLSFNGVEPHGFSWFPIYYFPLKESNKAYLLPLAFIHPNLRHSVNKIETIECKMWAKNIDFTHDKSASVKFKILLHDRNEN